MLVDAVLGMKAITSVYKGYGDLVNGERRGFCQLWVICTEQYQTAASVSSNTTVSGSDG